MWDAIVMFWSTTVKWLVLNWFRKYVCRTATTNHWLNHVVYPTPTNNGQNIWPDQILVRIKNVTRRRKRNLPKHWSLARSSKIKYHFGTFWRLGIYGPLVRLTGFIKSSGSITRLWLRLGLIVSRSLLKAKAMKKLIMILRSTKKEMIILWTSKTGFALMSEEKPNLLPKIRPRKLMVQLMLAIMYYSWKRSKWIFKRTRMACTNVQRIHVVIQQKLRRPWKTIITTLEKDLFNANYAAKSFLEKKIASITSERIPTVSNTNVQDAKPSFQESLNWRNTSTDSIK